MKNNTIFIVIALFLMQCKSDNNKQTKPVINNDIEFKGELIGKSLDNIQKKEAEFGIQIGFETIDIINYDIDGDKKNDVIKIERIKDWGDPGDFHKITINISGKDERIFFNSGGWVTISNYETQFVKNFVNETLIRSKYVAIQKASSTDVLLFSFGYVYASQPGLISVINLTKSSNAELIFNDNYHLYKFDDIDNDGKKDIIVTKADTEELNDKSNLKSFQLLNGWYKEK